MGVCRRVVVVVVGRYMVGVVVAVREGKCGSEQARP